MNVYSNKYQEKITKIYEEYREIVFPLVSFLETIDAEFPIEILNEIRSIFSHFSRAYNINSTDKEISNNLIKAENHLKRAILDCYKYGCLSLFDFYENFRKEYNFADLSNIDNGDFLSTITKNFADAKNKLLEAKKSEKIFNDSDDIYKYFEEAFLLFLENYNIINSKINIIHRVSKKAKWSFFWAKFGFWISLILTILSLIFAL